MGLFENNFDSDILRAIGYARLHQAAGSGLESVVAALAGADLGRVTKEFKPLVERMMEGEATEGVLQRAVRKAEHPGFGKFLSALMAEGERSTVRLEELSVEILAERANSAQQFGEQLNTMLQAAAVVFLGTFITVFLGVLELIPENKILPSFDFGDAFYTMVYNVLTIAIAVCFFGMWYRG